METGKPTIFFDHLAELKRRGIWISVTLLFGIFMGYLLRSAIIDALLKPVGEQKLIYTSPAGGLLFVLKISIFVGFIVSVPVTLYHILRFLEPAFRKYSLRFVSGILICSFIMMLLGGAVAYFLSLPAALHFLTQFSSDQIYALLTIEEYLNFVMIYIAGFAVLFQIPLIILFINRIKPLSPSGMIKRQSPVIIAGFLAAAIITPTPDPLNLIIMALPIILLYWVGILIVWVSNRKQTRPLANQRSKLSEAADSYIPANKDISSSRPTKAAYVISDIVPINQTVIKRGVNTT